jgi:NifU-like protein involved in Fe-S cluster formation
LDQYEILVNLSTNPNEDAKAYFESFGNDEKECVLFLGFGASFALHSRSNLSETLSDAQIERLEKLSEKYDEFVGETQSH